MSSRTNRKQKRTGNRSWGMVNVGLTILYAILALVLLFTMFNYNFLSFRFLNIIITIGLLVVLAISIFLQKTKKSPLVTTVVLVIFSLVSLVGIFGFKQMIDITNRMNQTAAFSEVEMSIVVPKESDIKDVSQLTSVQAPTKVDKNNIETLMSALKKDKKVDVKVDDKPVRIIGNGTVNIHSILPNVDLSDLHIKEMVNYIVLKSIIDTTDEKDLHDVIKERLDELIPKHVTNEDIISSISYLLNLEHGLGNVDDIDHLGNRRIRCVG